MNVVRKGISQLYDHLILKNGKKIQKPKSFFTALKAAGFAVLTATIMGTFSCSSAEKPQSKPDAKPAEIFVHDADVIEDAFVPDRGLRRDAAAVDAGINDRGVLDSAQNDSGNPDSGFDAGVTRIVARANCRTVIYINSMYVTADYGDHDIDIKDHRLVIYQNWADGKFYYHDPQNGITGNIQYINAFGNPADVFGFDPYIDGTNLIVRVNGSHSVAYIDLSFGLPIAYLLDITGTEDSLRGSAISGIGISGNNILVNRYKIRDNLGLRTTGNQCGLDSPLCVQRFDLSMFNPAIPISLYPVQEIPGPYTNLIPHPTALIPVDPALLKNMVTHNTKIAVLAKDPAHPYDIFVIDYMSGQTWANITDGRYDIRFGPYLSGDKIVFAAKRAACTQNCALELNLHDIPRSNTVTLIDDLRTYGDVRAIDFSANNIVIALAATTSTISPTDFSVYFFDLTRRNTIRQIYEDQGSNVLKVSIVTKGDNVLFYTKSVSDPFLGTHGKIVHCNGL